MAVSPFSVARTPRARAELRGDLHTMVSRVVALGTTVVFLLFIYAIPVSQAVLEKTKGEDSTLLPLFQRAPTRDNLRQFEKDLEAGSYAKDFVQPRMQLLLTRFGRVGNKRAVVGHRGFLFYTPGLTYLSGPSFITPDAIRSREKAAVDAGDTVHADPRPAILAFHDMLAARNIRLFLFPVPDKTMLQPMELHGRADPASPLPVAKNAGLAALSEWARSHGIEVFDPTPSTLLPAAPPHFLTQDTHYTPEWMERVARELAEAVSKTVRFEGKPVEPPLRAVPQEVERVGDLVDMLKLPDDQTWFLPQRVTVHQVRGADDAPWEPDPAAEVLLLGDSFTNVFSLEGMGWGEAAGLAPHLALALGRGVDVIAQNDSGAFATRQALARELAADGERLKGKRAVVWEFASRELAVGDWKPVDWNPAKPEGGQ
jgi:hypothetical protein